VRSVDMPSQCISVERDINGEVLHCERQAAHEGPHEATRLRGKIYWQAVDSDPSRCTSVTRRRDGQLLHCEHPAGHEGQHEERRGRETVCWEVVTSQRGAIEAVFQREFDDEPT
jgi:hypothetical protein